MGRWTLPSCATYWARRGASSSLTLPPRCFWATPAARFCRSTSFCEGGWTPRCSPREVAEHLRALLLAQTVGEATAELLECTPEDAQRYREQAQGAVREQLFRLMELFMRVEPDMKWAADPRAMLELTAVRACCPEEEKDATLSERVGRLEAAIERGAAVAAPAREAPRAARGPRARQGARAQGRPAAKERRGSAAAVSAGGGGACQGQPLDARGAGGHEVRRL